MQCSYPSCSCTPEALHGAAGRAIVLHLLNAREAGAETTVSGRLCKHVRVNAVDEPERHDSEESDEAARGGLMYLQQLGFRRLDLLEQRAAALEVLDRSSLAGDRRATAYNPLPEQVQRLLAVATDHLRTVQVTVEDSGGKIPAIFTLVRSAYETTGLPEPLTALRAVDTLRSRGRLIARKPMSDRGECEHQIESHQRLRSSGRTRGRWATGIASVTVASLFTVSIPAANATTGESLDVATSERTVITGTVARDGRPVKHADILLIAWPNHSTLAALEDGERVPTLAAGRVVANASGRFAVDVDPADIPSQYKEPDGGVHFEVVAADATEEVFWEFSTAGGARSAKTHPALAVWPNARVSEDSLRGRAARNIGPTHIDLDLGMRPTARELDDDPATWIDDEESQRVVPSQAVLRGSAPKEPRRADFDRRIDSSDGGFTTLGQGWCATGTYQNGRTESFMRTVGTTQAKNYVVQTSSSSHTLGIAYKSGSTSSWTQDGTTTTTTGVSSTDHLGYNVTIRNQVNYRKHIPCDGVPLGAERWRPSSIHSLGSSYVLHSSRPAWTAAANCTTYPGSTGVKEKTVGTNVTFSSGVNFSYVSLSAKAAYASSTVQRWTPTNTGSFKLCGSTSSGWAGAPQAGAFVP